MNEVSMKVHSRNHWKQEVEGGGNQCKSQQIASHRLILVLGWYCSRLKCFSLSGAIMTALGYGGLASGFAALLEYCAFFPSRRCTHLRSFLHVALASAGECMQCDLCPRQCKLHAGDRGFCFVRQNVGGELLLMTYGLSTGFCVDPTEKKPLKRNWIKRAASEARSAFSSLCLCAGRAHPIRKLFRTQKNGGKAQMTDEVGRRAAIYCNAPAFKLAGRHRN